MERQGTVLLETDKILLRPFAYSDADDMFNNYCNDEEVCQYVTWEKHGNIENTKAYLNTFVNNYSDKNQFQWAIVLKETNQVCGAIGVVNSSENECEIGWVIAKNLWNKGLVSSCGKKVIQYLFTQSFEKIKAKFDSRNIASGKVMSKIGMDFAKIEKQVPYRNENNLIDLVYFEITKKSFFNKLNFQPEYSLFLQEWGNEAQLRMAIEEMSELIKEISKFIRFTRDIDLKDKKEEKLTEISKNLKEELADVLNMADQLKFMLGEDEINDLRKEKIKRTLSRLSK